MTVLATTQRSGGRCSAVPLTVMPERLAHKQPLLILSMLGCPKALDMAQVELQHLIGAGGPLRLPRSPTGPLFRGFRHRCQGNPTLVKSRRSGSTGRARLSLF